MNEVIHNFLRRYRKMYLSFVLFLRKIIILDCILFKDLKEFKFEKAQDRDPNFKYEFQYLDKIIILFCIYIPKIVIICSLLIDLSNNELHYFYKSLLLLIFPLLKKYLYLMLKDFFILNLNILNCDINREKFINRSLIVLEKNKMSVVEHNNNLISILRGNIANIIYDEDEVYEMEYDILVRYYNKDKVFNLYRYFSDELNLLERFHTKYVDHSLFVDIIYYLIIVIVIIYYLIIYYNKII